MMTAIKRLVEMYPHGVKSITCDRGSEFVNQFEIGLIEDTFDCKIYYANPCAPHERDQMKIIMDYSENIFQNHLILKIFLKIRSIKLFKV